MHSTRSLGVEAGLSLLLVVVHLRYRSMLTVAGEPWRRLSDHRSDGDLGEAFAAAFRDHDWRYESVLQLPAACTPVSLRSRSTTSTLFSAPGPTTAFRHRLAPPWGLRLTRPEEVAAEWLSYGKASMDLVWLRVAERLMRRQRDPRSRCRASRK